MLKKPIFLLRALMVLLVVIQFFRPDRSNPPANPAATFESVAKPTVELTAVVSRACYNCHSNNTVWPWYSRVAPISWLVANDVHGGRAHMNFSEWGSLSAEVAHRRLQDACDEVQAGDMPPWQYRLVLPEARLTPQDVKVICAASGR